MQVFTPSLHCAAMLLGVTLRGMVLVLQKDRERLEVQGRESGRGEVKYELCYVAALSLECTNCSLEAV